MTTNSNSTPKTNGQTTIELPFNEAPATWNTKYIDPSGFECMITLRVETGQELLDKAASAIAFLLKNNCIPCTFSKASSYHNNGSGNVSNGNGTNGGHGADKPESKTENGQNASPSWCPKHQCEMRKFEKEGRVWYSHKTADGRWCKGK